MASNYHSMMDPSLPLDEQSLVNLPPPLPSRQVRFLPDPPSIPEHPPYPGEVLDIPEPAHHDSAGWQVDGSNHSLTSDKTTSSFQAAYTMREYDDQLNSLKKENFNLKLRIYFMEEKLGLLPAPKEQENIYRVNIDLKVHSEELKKDLAEKSKLLSQAAQALQSQEEKYKARIDNLNSRLENEQGRRMKAEEAAEEVRMEVRDLREQKDGERRISDESKLLYAEAFGSINLGIGKVDSDGTKNYNRDQNEWEKQSYELTEIVNEKNKLISDLEAKNANLTNKIRDMDDAKDARYEVIEFKQKYEEILRENQKLKMDTENCRGVLNEYDKRNRDKEYMLKDCNVYIESLTEQLNEKTEEIEKLNDRVQNNSAIQGRDEEIASLQAEIALHHDQKEKLDQMEIVLANHRECEDRIRMLEAELVEQKESLSCEFQQKVDDKINEIDELQKELDDVKIQYNTVTFNVEEHGTEVVQLKSDLDKRNTEVLSLKQLLRKMNNALKEQGSPDYLINGDVFDVEVTDLSWDHGFDNIEPTKNLTEKLLTDNQENDKLIDDQDLEDKVNHINYLNERCGDLENILAEKYNIIADLNQRVKDLSKLEIKLEESEKEQFEMQTYLNKKLAEMKKLRQLLSSEKESNVVNESKLQKAVAAIQGFVTENLKLSQTINTLTSEKEALISENRNKNDDVLCEENERLKAEIEKLKNDNLEASAKTRLMQRGIDKARVEFSNQLGEYRGKFNTVVSCWRAGNDACELMRVRLEELADFLQQLLDMEGEGGDLNLSCLSLDMRESLQKSIDESRLLSASVLANQSSMLQEMSMVGLQVGEEEQMDELDQEEWVVPEVEVSLFEDEDALGEVQETVLKAEYDSLLLELRDNLRKRRVAEEELESMRRKVAALEEPNMDITKNDDGSKLKLKSKLPVTVLQRGRSLTPASKVCSNSISQRKSPEVRKDSVARSHSYREARGRSGSRVRKQAENVEDHQRRKTLTKIPCPQLGEEEDCWSEPDKEESRRRIGLESDFSASIGHGRDGGGQSHRTTDDEVLGGELGTELRRERGRVERLRGDLVIAGRIERELKQELVKAKEEVNTYKNQLQKSIVEVKTVNELLAKFDIQKNQIDEENVNVRKESERVTVLEEEKHQLEDRVRQGDEVIEKLNKGIQWWEDECKKMKELVKEHDGKNIEINKLTKGLNRYEAKCKQMINQYENLTQEVKKWKDQAEAKTRECEHFNKDFEVLTEDIKKYENYFDKMKEEHELLQSEVEKWKNLAKDKTSEDVSNIAAKQESELQLAVKELAEKKMEMDQLQTVNSRLEKSCGEFEVLMKQNDAKVFELEERIRILTYETERKDKSIATKDENLSIAERLVTELNDAKKKVEKHLESVSLELNENKREIKSIKDSFEVYKKEFNDEITQNKVNEVEIKMKTQALGIKKFAEEMLKIESKARMIESQKVQVVEELQLKEDQIRMYKKEIQKLTEVIQQEKYRSDELGQTIQNMRNNVEKLETEKMLKDSLEIEYKNLKETLALEKDVQIGLNEKIDKLEKRNKLTEERCLSAEKVLKSISADSFSVDKENKKSNMSKHELEAVLLHSRPSSRRQGLSALDHNTSSVLATSIPSTEPMCCSHWAELEQVKLERDAALSKLASTRSSLATTAEKLSMSNRRKKQVEKAICQQLTKTHEVLKKTKTNLENANVDSQK